MRRLVSRTIRGSALRPGIAALAGCVACWACGDCEPPRVPGAFVDQPRGAGCRSAAECAQGLACVGSVCATRCSVDTDCPQDCSCILQACLLRCDGVDDSPCIAGATSGECVTFHGYAPVCMPRICLGEHSDSTCSAGYRCVGQYRWTGDTSGAEGVGGAYCPTTGWCQKVPD